MGKDEGSQCYGMKCVPEKFYTEALMPNVTAFGDRSFKEIIRLNYVIKMEP